MWYCGTDETDLSEQEPTKQAVVSNEPLAHKWGRPAPVAYGGPTVAHVAFCKACDAQGQRRNPSGKAGKGYMVTEPWCPEACPGVKTSWARVQKEWFEKNPECDPHKRSPLCIDQVAPTEPTTQETTETALARLLGN